MLVRAGEKSDVTVVTGGDSRVKGPCREPGGGAVLPFVQAESEGAQETAWLCPWRGAQ